MTQPPDPRDPRRPPPPSELDDLAIDLLEAETPIELPMDALIMEEPPPELIPEEALDAPFDPYVEPEEAIPLIEGFEATGIEERAQRPKPEERGRIRKPARPEFTFTTCPDCGTPQPDPAPAFCESCGQRMRKPGKKGAAAAGTATKRCAECGYKNGEHASSCTNCGSRL